MISRSALCTGRSTVVLVVLLLSTFITFDSYTYQLFSSWSKSVSSSFFTDSSKDDLDSIESSWASETGYKSISEVGQEGERTNIDSQAEVDLQAKKSSKDQLEDQNQGASSLEENSFDTDRGEKPERYDFDTPLTRSADVPKRPLPGNNQTSGYMNVSKSQDVNHTGSSKACEGDRLSAPTTAAAKMRVSELTSIQRLEWDLWQARAALKRVALKEMDIPDTNEGSDHLPDAEPQGTAYKDGALFRQSYQEMENRLKIYIYAEGEEPLVHDGPCKEIYAVEGRFIQELHDHNPFVTSNPEEAHVFFLPFSVAMMVTYLYTQNSGDMSPLLRFVQDYVHVIADKYSYWNRSEGADHFMLSCHDWGPYVSRVDNNLYSKTIRVLCNANTSEGFIPYKDASLPEINLVGGEVPTALGGLPVSARTYLAFFAGADHGPVRPRLFKHWEGKDSDILVHRRVPPAGLTYHEYMKSSKFCICPGGYEVSSPRVVEAIYNDCIPVIIADNFILPFTDVLDWSKFSLQVLEDDIPKLKAILEGVPLETLVKMQSRLKQVRKHFLLNQPPERRSESFRPQPFNNPFDIQHAPWKPLVKHQCNSATARTQEIDALRTRALTILKRATKIFDRKDETPRDISRESYGRQTAWRRSAFGSTIGVQRMDPLIDIRPPRDCFMATQAHNLLNLVTSVVDTHHQRQAVQGQIGTGQPRVKKVEKIPPLVLLPPFNLRVKQRALPKSYYLEGSLRVRRETQRLKENEKAEDPERDSFLVAGRGIRDDAWRSAGIHGGIRYQNTRKSVLGKLEDYNRSYQAKRELSHRASEYMKEKRRSRSTLLAEKERHSMEVKAAIETARRSSQMTILRKNLGLGRGTN